MSKKSKFTKWTSGMTLLASAPTLASWANPQQGGKSNSNIQIESKKKDAQAQSNSNVISTNILKGIAYTFGVLLVIPVLVYGGVLVYRKIELENLRSQLEAAKNELKNVNQGYQKAIAEKREELEKAVEKQKLIVKKKEEEIKKNYPILFLIHHIENFFKMFKAWEEVTNETDPLYRNCYYIRYPDGQEEDGVTKKSREERFNILCKYLGKIEEEFEKLKIEIDEVLQLDKSKRLGLTKEGLFCKLKFSGFSFRLDEVVDRLVKYKDESLEEFLQENPERVDNSGVMEFLDFMSAIRQDFVIGGKGYSFKFGKIMEQINSESKEDRESFNEDLNSLKEADERYVELKKKLGELTEKNKNFETLAGIEFTGSIGSLEDQINELNGEIKIREDNFYNIDFFSSKE